MARKTGAVASLLAFAVLAFVTGEPIDTEIFIVQEGRARAKIVVAPAPPRMVDIAATGRRPTRRFRPPAPATTNATSLSGL